MLFFSGFCNFFAFDKYLYELYGWMYISSRINPIAYSAKLMQFLLFVVFSACFILCVKFIVLFNCSLFINLFFSLLLLN